MRANSIPTKPLVLLLRSLQRERNQSLFASSSSSSSSSYSSSVPNKKAKVAVGVEGFLKEASRNVRDGSWQVLEARETDTPGEIMLFVMTTPGSITKIPLTLSRKVNVVLNANSSMSQQFRHSSKGKLRKDWFLPHGGDTPSSEVWELTVSEAKFQSYLTTLLTMPDIESVCSTEYPLIFDFLRDIGGVGRVVGKTDSGKWKLDDLEGVKGRDYLDEKAVQFKRIFLFSKVLQSSGIVSVFLPIDYASNSADPVPDSNDISGTCIMYVLKPKGNNERGVKAKVSSSETRRRRLRGAKRRVENLLHQLHQSRF